MNRHTSDKGGSPTEVGRSPSGPGYSAEPEPSCTVSAVPVSIPNAEQSDEWKRGYAAGCAWYADYIQRIADIRERRSVVLRMAVQKLPDFSAHWSQERRDQWFDWFFDLLEQASAIEARRAATPQSDAVHESAASEAGDAPKVSAYNPNERLREALEAERLLASIWFYGGFHAETHNERLLQQHMERVGLWPIGSETELIDKMDAALSHTIPID